MAIFFGKGGSSGNSDGGKTPGPDPAAEFSPQKATRFFDHAKTVLETGNYEYAMQSYLNGLRWDPGSTQGLQGFFHATAKFLEETGGKKGVSKETSKAVSEKGDVFRYLAGLLEWGLKPEESVLGVRAMEGAVRLHNPEKANLTEAVLWIGDRAFALTRSDKKARKDSFLKLSEYYGKAGAFDRAVAAAEAALRLDPTDGQLSAYIRSLAAQATMVKGGFDATGQAGGFRKNIRDADKQRHLEEADRVVKTEETIDRLVKTAAEQYKERPGDLPTLETYAKRLLERGRPADEEGAHQLYAQAYAETKQFRFRELSGDIRIRQARRKVSDLKRMLEQAPNEEMLQRMLAQAQEEFQKLELGEFEMRSANYPTDLQRKFELGKRYFASGLWDKAIEAFQEAQGDARYRTDSLNYLGQSFLQLQLNDEAVETFRRAVENRDLSPEELLERRYWLMVALQGRAEEHRDPGAADEASKLAASIAAQQFSYRDIRARREALKKLVGELRPV